MKFRTPLLSLFLLLLPIWWLSSCYYSTPRPSDRWSPTAEGQVDSLDFYARHHYWIGFNFELTDSLSISLLPPQQGREDYVMLPTDSIVLKAGQKVVVAQVMFDNSHENSDSVWVKVARDQLAQGWVSEEMLVSHAVPDDPISQFIHNFSDSRTLFVLTAAGLCILFILIQTVRHGHIRIVHFRDIPSFYPTLLCLCVSGAATIYGSMQRFVPETWVEFYYHPTLNPFNPDIPLILALFICSVWTMLIVGIAVIDEIRRLPDLGDNLTYLATLGGVCMVLYLVFTMTVPLIFGYVLLVAYWFFAIRRYMLHGPSHLFCGACHESIPHKGRCPHCGAWNE